MIGNSLYQEVNGGHEKIPAIFFSTDFGEKR
jgi:hypothetical protein